MKLATVSIQGAERFGVVDGESFIDLSGHFAGRCHDIPGLLANDLLDEARKYAAAAEAPIPLSGVAYLPVVARADARMFALGWSYKDHQLETNKDATPFPNMFSKLPQSLVGHEQALIKPRVSEMFDYEGEVAIIIGKAGRHISQAAASAHIAGFSIVNDGSVRDLQKQSITAGKNFDASSAYGPWLVTADEVPDPGGMVITTRLNGETMQHSPFSLMVWDLSYLVHYVSTFCRLQPGDSISTGTPGGIGARRSPPRFMKAGDIIEVEVTGIGVLRNVVREEAPA
jgi:2-keto-4-pentenoate hydratase/2-oxohepta-3-ene-1,7-dioic acid hydratase in catechol pathway